MPRYISRLYVIVDASGPDDAADVMSACLTDNLMHGSHIVDWCYTKDPLGSTDANHGYTHPVELPEAYATAADYREEDVDGIFQAAQIVSR